MEVGGDGPVHDRVTEPGPENKLPGQLEPSMPPGDALTWPKTTDQVIPTEEVEVEASEGENGVIEIGLVLDDELGHVVVRQDAVVVGRVQTAEEAMGDGEEGHEFDVGVMFGGVGDDVVDVVAPLPPAQTEAAEKVGDDDADDGVDGEIMGDAHMAGIMGGEDQLMPEDAEEETANGIASIL